MSPGASALVGHELRARLGPTNTGKTFAAIERMLVHASGMIGLPLRLLAREVYDRVSAQVGEAAVALVTGEEKRVPAHPRYWVCTVEAMPRTLEVDFLAVDEVQLAGHAERGHVFTDRLLAWRGRRETWFLGSETMRPLCEHLAPAAAIEWRPRLSTLTCAGNLTLGALPPRSAVVAFSVPRVYELAERLRAKRGGAAVVLGALSPRTRNAQVALYQSGEVDHMVATDAIGMGLNMDVDCVAFADLRKYDGARARDLEDAELAQIAGRAGRNRNDGRFATLLPLPPLDPAVVRAIEQHRFTPQKRIWWRHTELSFASVAALLGSLQRPPPAALAPWLRMVTDAEDHQSLMLLAKDDAVLRHAEGEERVRMLWDVCQIPDFRKLALDDHVHLLRAVFLQLCQRRGRLDRRWLDSHLDTLDNVRGDIDLLMARQANIRTWTFISHRTAWVDDAAGVQERARAIEDRLSDALHGELCTRFVDVVRKRRARPGTPAPTTTGGERPAKVRSFADLSALPIETRDARDPVVTWLEDLVDAPHARFTLSARGRIVDGDRVVARLGRGRSLTLPDVRLALAHDPPAGLRLQLERRLVAWTRDLVSALLAPLHAPVSHPLSPAALGLLYQLHSTLGTVRARDARDQMRALDPRERRALQSLGVQLGRQVVFAPELLAPGPMKERVALVEAFTGVDLGAVTAGCPPRLDPAPSLDPQLLLALGYPVFAGKPLRADLAEASALDLRRGRAPRDALSAFVEEPTEVEALARALGARPR
jgi:ATP-dependent RNA helicase SUPV3L1/SUV3